MTELLSLLFVLLALIAGFASHHTLHKRRRSFTIGQYRRHERAKRRWAQMMSKVRNETKEGP